MLTEKEAWLEMAKLWEDAVPCSCGCETWRVEADEDSAGGLCDTLSWLQRADVIAAETYYIMNTKLKDYGRRILGAYYWPQNAEGAKARVEFCKTQAENLGC